MSINQFEDFRVKGCVCAPFTLLKDDGEINFDGFEDYAKYLVSQKFTYLFVNGTLAEGLSLTLEERKQTAEAWVKVAKGRFGIILHIGTNNYKDSQELACRKIGVDAIACFAPSFYKPDSLETLVEYISKVASAAPNTPFFYYCINFFTGVYLNDAKFLELAESKIPNLVGLKHSSRELPNAHRCMMVNPKKFQVMIGSDVQLLTSLSLGIEVPVIASFLGQLFDNMKTAFDKVDMKTASKYQCQAQEINTIRSEFGAGINVAKAMFNIVSGLNAGPVRLPLTDLSQEQKQKLKEKIDSTGIFK
ncbi:N-acetylneuraminate lyase [Mytilus galloprovincialis]|uniref:N-acetylneuraminate lyase n=1 Tax=Mytilus galloprovincialis TaxID=29158 RepID=A0A8B6BDX2_MYTGA|nr:N-acetylneuraminate lyase [Mytilus galloprovincialis]